MLSFRKNKAAMHNGVRTIFASGEKNEPSPKKITETGKTPAETTNIYAAFLILRFIKPFPIILSDRYGPRTPALNVPLTESTSDGFLMENGLLTVRIISAIHMEFSVSAYLKNNGAAKTSVIIRAALNTDGESPLHTEKSIISTSSSKNPSLLFSFKRLNTAEKIPQNNTR